MRRCRGVVIVIDRLILIDAPIDAPHRTETILRICKFEYDFGLLTNPIAGVVK